MDTRKALLSGVGGSFVITIPSAYCKKHNVKKGDVFRVDEDDKGRLVYTRMHDPNEDEPVDIFGSD